MELSGSRLFSLGGGGNGIKEILYKLRASLAKQKIKNYNKLIVTCI
jgi:hypothetical protein